MAGTVDVGTLLVKYNADTGQLTTATSQAKSALSSVSDTAQSSGGGVLGGFGKMIGGAVDFAAKIGQTIFGMQALAQGAISLGSALLEPNASMEQTTVAFKQLLGSSSAATAELKDLQSFAASTPFEFPELADSTQKLLAFQYPLKETKPLLTAIGDALSGLGENTAAKLDQVVSVFGQMKSSAHLMTGDVMQLTSVGINGFQILADQMHKPVSVIKDMLSSGLIPANNGIEMLRKGMEKTFGGGMAAQATTFNGLISTFQDNIGAAWRTMSGPLFDVAKQGLIQLGNLVSGKQFQGFATMLGEKVGGALRVMTTNMNVAIPVLAGLGAIIAAVLIPAVGTLAVEVAIATWPFLLIGAAVAGLVAIFMHFYQTNAGFKSFIDNLVKGFQQLWTIIVAGVTPAFKAIGNFIQTIILPILQQIGAYLVSTFAPVWQQLVQVWNSQILPSLKQLWAALQPLAPVLLFIGEVIGGVVLISFGLMVGILSGVIQAIAGLLSGLATFIGGVVQMVTGFIQIISGIVQFIADLVTGHFDKLGSDLGLIWTGIKNMFVGMWNMIKGVFQAAIGIITGLIGGFISGVVGYFTTLYNDLVGHSIIPDMINGIINWFMQLPGRVGAAVQSMSSTAMSILNGMAGLALQAGFNIVNSVANGIASGVGAVASAIASVVATIDAHLPHSPAKVGPLRTLPQAGANIVQQLNAGMLSAQPNLRATMTHVVAYPIRPGAIGVASAASAQHIASGSTGDHTTIVEIDSYQLATLVQKSTDRLVRLKLQAKGRSI